MAAAPPLILRGYCTPLEFRRGKEKRVKDERKKKRGEKRDKSAKMLVSAKKLGIVVIWGGEGGGRGSERFARRVSLYQISIPSPKLNILFLV